MLQQLIPVKPDERRPATILFYSYFLMTVTYVMANNAASSLFVTGDGNEFYPLLMTANTVVTIILVAAFRRLVRQMPLNSLAAATNLLISSLYIIFVVALQFTGWASALMVILSLGQLTIGSFQYYLIASTIFDARQAKRILGLVGVGGALAYIMGGVVLVPFIRLLATLPGEANYGSQAVIVLVAVLLVVQAGVIRRLRPYMTRTAAPQPQAEQPTRRQLTFDPYLIAITLIVASFIMVATSVDVQFQAQGNIAFAGDADAFTEYRGYYSLATGGLQLVMRLFVVTPLLLNVGLLAGLIVTPITMVVTTAAFLWRPNLITASLMKGGDQGTRYTINETATELLWVPIPPEQRLAAKPFISGTVIAVTQGITGISLFFLPDGNPRLPSLVVLTVTAVWLGAVVVAQRGYLSKLMDSVRRRQWRFTDLQADTADSALVQTISTSLMGGTDLERAFLLDVIEDVPVDPWADALRRTFKMTDSDLIKERIILLAAQRPDIVTDDQLLDLIRADGTLTDEALFAAGKRQITHAAPLMVERLDSVGTDVRAAAASALYLLDTGTHKSQAVTALQAMLTSSDVEASSAALRLIVRMERASASELVDASLLRVLLQRELVVRLLALDVIQLTRADGLPDVVRALGHPVTEQPALATLRVYWPATVREVLISQFKADTNPPELRAAIARALRGYRADTALVALTRSLTWQIRPVYSSAVDSLLTLARAEPLPDVLMQDVQQEVSNLARTLYSLRIALDTAQAQNETLLAEAFRIDIEDLTPTLLQLAVMDVPHTDIESIIYRLQERDPKTIGNVLEILDNVLSAEERRTVIPLFEDRPTSEISEIGQDHFPHLDTSLNDELLFYINHGDDWQCAVALDYIRRHPETNLQLAINPDQVNERSRQLIARQGSSAAETLLTRPDRQEAKMHSILEKTLLLKNSALFEQIDANDLYRIAQITEELHLPPQTTLFQHGDPGEAMYIVSSGAVRIHNGEVTIATVSDGGVIGEIALLDQKPRTATATTVTDTHFLVIQADAFFATIGAYIDINRSIMRLIASRLRSMVENEQGSSPETFNP